MSNWTYLAYLAVFGFWFYCVYRDGRTGIGIRLMFGINLSLYFLVGPALGEVFGTEDLRFFLHPVEPAAQLALGALASYVFAAYLLMPVLVRRRTLVPDKLVRLGQHPGWVATQVRLGWALVGLGTFGLLTTGMASRIPTLGAVLGQMGQLADAGFLILVVAYVTARRFRPLGWVLAVMFGRGLILAAISGHAAVIVIGGCVAMFIAVTTDRLRLGRVTAGLLLALVLTVPTSYWLAGRSDLRQAIREGASLTDTVSLTLDIFFSPRPMAASGFADRYRQRGDYSDLMAAAMTHTPAIQPYAGGDTYVESLSALLPRFIWTDKQVIAGGNEFVSQYTGVTFAHETSVAMHYMFEMYVNFGTPGVVIGMMLLGLLMAGLEHLYYISLPERFFWQYASVYAAAAISLSSDRASDVLMTVPPGLVMCALVWYLASAAVIAPRLGEAAQ